MSTTDAPTTTTLSRTLAEWVARVTIEDIPASVLATAREHATDALGIAIASSGMDFGAAMHRASVKLGTGTECGAIGFPTRLPAPSAALLNGTLIHGLDFDDTHIGAIYHATAPALAAALAAGEAAEADGATVLLALVVGLEAGCRLAQAGTGKFSQRGFHPTGILGAFAATCVTAKIRGLSADELTDALGLCGSQAAGILELKGSWLKRMHPGWAAHCGIIAATLGEAGYRGPSAVFEGPGGLYRSHIEEIPDAEQLSLPTLGERWATSEIALKPYPCCHFIHAFVDASLALLDELGVETLPADAVAGIECPTSPLIIPMVAEPAAEKIAPSSIYEGLFSIPYVVARALTTRRVDLDSFYSEPLDDPAVLAMAAKVTCPPDPDSDFPAHFPGEVRITLADGREVARRFPASHGSIEDPMSSEEIRDKFYANATRRISSEQADRIAAIVDELETLPDIGQLIEACTVPSDE